MLQDFSGEVQYILLTLKSTSVAQPAGFLNAYRRGLLRPLVSQLPDKVSWSIHFWPLMLLRTNELLIIGGALDCQRVSFTLVTWLRCCGGK